MSSVLYYIILYYGVLYYIIGGETGGFAAGHDVHPHAAQGRGRRRRGPAPRQVQVPRPPGCRPPPLTAPPSWQRIESFSRMAPEECFFQLEHRGHAPSTSSLSLSLSSLSLSLSAPSTFLRPPASPARLRVAQLGLHALPQGRLPGGPHRQDSLARCASPPPSLAAAAAAAAAPLVFGMVVAHIGGVASACEMSNIVRFFAAFGFA